MPKKKQSVPPMLSYASEEALERFEQAVADSSAHAGWREVVLEERRRRSTQKGIIAHGT